MTVQASSPPLEACNEVVDVAEPAPPQVSAAMPAEGEDRKHRFSPILRSPSRELPEEVPVLILTSSDDSAASAPSVVTQAELFVPVEAPQAQMDALPCNHKFITIQSSHQHLIIMCLIHSNFSYSAIKVSMRHGRLRF